MKNYIKGIITIIIIAVLSCNAVYAAEYIESAEFVKKDMHYVCWSGKEWITTEQPFHYPIKVSHDGVEFTEIAVSEEVKSELKDSRYKYVWTGKDYLAYSTHHIWRDYDSPKYLYRLSEDFQTILNKYEIPNWILSMSFIDDKVYITAANKIPTMSGDRVLGENYYDYGLYYSYDFIDWVKVENDTIKNPFDMVKTTNNKLLINSMYLYSAEKTDKIIKEKHAMYIRGSMEPYLNIGECLIGPATVQDRTALTFSNDGIYWVYMLIDNLHSPIQTIEESNNEIVIRTSHDTYYACDKETLYNCLREKLPQNPVYVKLDGNYLGFEQPPVIEDGRTLVPMRFIFEQMGAEVDWNGETRSITATKDGMTVTLTIDDINATVNGEATTLDVPARLINDKTMIPLRFLSENLGYTVDWDADTRTASITAE